MNLLRTSGRAAMACVVMLAASGVAFADEAAPAAPTYVYVPLMMGGPGPGAGWGGYGMGPGYRMGPMMGGAGMSPMAGGMGMGHMMGGPGTGRMMGGPGAMGPQWQNVLDLTAEQREALTRIHEETRNAHRAIMGELLTQQGRLRDLVTAPTLDSEALAATANTINGLRQRMLDSASEAHKNMRAVLTPEQLERLQALWPRPPAAAE